MTPASQPAAWTRVLVASRDGVFARSLAGALRASGAEVRLRDARGPWTAHPAELAGVDVIVVEASGSDDPWRLVEQVRERAPMVEIVAISEDRVVERAVEALRAGVYTLLPYPVADGTLVEAVAQATARKRRGEQRMRALGAS